MYPGPASRVGHRTTCPNTRGPLSRSWRERGFSRLDFVLCILWKFIDREPCLHRDVRPGGIEEVLRLIAKPGGLARSTMLHCRKVPCKSARLPLQKTFSAQAGYRKIAQRTRGNRSLPRSLEIPPCDSHSVRRTVAISDGLSAASTSESAQESKLSAPSGLNCGSLRRFEADEIQ